MQKADIQLPPQDLFDLWDFTLLIAKSICPSLREAGEHTWLRYKLEPLPGTEFDTRSDLTEQERQELLRLLPQLPSHASPPKADAKIFMEVFMSHPERPAWKPIFGTEDEVTANSFEILKIQEVHLRALKQEIEDGNIHAVDRHHRPETRAGKNICIGRDDALRYLRQRHLHIAEDPRDESVSKSPRPSRPAKASQSSPHRATMGRPEQINSASSDDITSQVKGDDRKPPSALPPSPAQVASPTPPPVPAKRPSLAPPPKTQDIATVDQGKQATSAPLVILRRKQVEARTSLSRSGIYDRLDPDSPRHDPSFPKQVKLSSNASGWVESEIDDWLQARLSARK